MRSLTQNSGHSANHAGDFTGLNEVVRKGSPPSGRTRLFSSAQFPPEAGQPGKGFAPVETAAVHDRMPAILDLDAVAGRREYNGCEQDQR
jgi:hypothetical protein